LSLLLDLYAPLPEPTFRRLLYMATGSSLSPALGAKTFEQLRNGPEVHRVTLDGMDWLLPAAEALRDDVVDRVRVLAPFDPLVWDRRRFAQFWGWDYRFEAYTPPAKRKIGYYALPLLWRDDVVGWVNAALKEGTLSAAVGFAKAMPRTTVFRRELDAELERFRLFVGADRVAARIEAS
ncbi:MAG: crosslink repair DNA glycosylase YcaQ family protein, partial [Casimicrobiaceae bacterium]